MQVMQVMQVHLSEAARLRSCLACSTAFCTKLPIWRALDSAVRAKTSSGIVAKAKPHGIWVIPMTRIDWGSHFSSWDLSAMSVSLISNGHWMSLALVGHLWSSIMKPHGAVPPPMPQSVMPPFHHSRCWRMLAASLDLNPRQWKLDKRNRKIGAKCTLLDFHLSALGPDSTKQGLLKAEQP